MMGPSKGSIELRRPPDDMLEDALRAFTNLSDVCPETTRSRLMARSVKEHFCVFGFRTNLHFLDMATVPGAAPAAASAAGSVPVDEQTVGGAVGVGAPEAPFSEPAGAAVADRAAFHED